MVVYLAFHHLKTSRNAKMSSKLRHACPMLQNFIMICRISIEKNAEFRMSILKRIFFFAQGDRFLFATSNLGSQS